MKNKKLLFNFGIVSGILLILTTGAFAQKVKYNFLQGTDFTKYKTYRWVKIEKAQYPNQLLDNQIMASIDNQLKLKGLTKVESDEADLAVVYQVAIDQEKQWNSYSTGGGGWGWGGWGGWGGYGGMQTTTGSTSTITIGTLNLDFYEIASKKQIWLGEATKTLDPPKDPNKLQKNIDKAMAKLLKNYPPPIKK